MHENVKDTEYNAQIIEVQDRYSDTVYGILLENISHYCGTLVGGYCTIVLKSGAIIETRHSTSQIRLLIKLASGEKVTK